MIEGGGYNLLVMGVSPRPGDQLFFGQVPAELLDRAACSLLFVASDESASLEQLRQGVQMTLQQLHQLLRHHGIEPEESLGQPFDPLRHEAVGTCHVPSQPDHIVLEVPQRGYRRGQEMFRPAKVIVNHLGRAEALRHTS